MTPIIEQVPCPLEEGSEIPITPKLRHSYRRVWQTTGLLVLVVAILVAGGSWLRPYQFHGIYLQSPTPAPDFTLLASTSLPVRLSDFQGKIVLLFFGYTACPDVCPLRLAELMQMMKVLGNKAKNVQVILVTVDPLQDRPEHLHHYVTAFNASFLGMTGSPAMINTVATQFGIFYAQEATSAAGAISHTSTVTVIDAAGYVRLLFPAGLTPVEMAQDVEHLLKN